MAELEFERIRDALEFIPADDRDTWLRMGMGLKSALGDDGFALWNEWSQRDDSYDAGAAKSVWRSIKAGGGITVASLFREAKLNGWTDDGLRRPTTPTGKVHLRKTNAVRLASDAQRGMQRERDRTANLAALILSHSRPATAENPYLKRKGINPIGVLREIDSSEAAAKLGYRPRQNGTHLNGSLLVVPIEIEGILSTLELIDGEGRKAALVGRGTKAGGYWSTKPLPAGAEAAIDIVIGEGVATVISASLAYGALGVAAFSDTNLLCVSEGIKRRYPSASVTILADLEKTSKHPNTKAVAAASAVQARLAVPSFGDHLPANAKDFNDMARLLGDAAVTTSIREASTVEASTVEASTVEASTVEARDRGAPKDKSIELVKASSVAPEQFQWLWKDFLPAGKLTLLAGAPGTGKTTIAIALAATISRGGLWPDATRSPRGSVVIWSGEDAVADTLVPRLIAAGADLDRVHFVGDAREGAQRRTFDPAKDMEGLKRSISELPDADLVIVDPIVSAVAGDSHKNAETRRGLQPLADLGAAIGCGILGITHFSKGTAGRDPVERLTGSLAFGALARVVLVAASENADGDGERKRIVVRAKSNIGPDGGGFTYGLQYEPLPGHPEIIASRVVWQAAINGSARELLSKAETVVDNGAASELDEAKTFLSDLLRSEEIEVKRVRANGKEAGLSWATIRRAKKALGVKARKSSMEGAWFWGLPGRCSAAHEGAQRDGVSTFDEFEHLRPEDAAWGDSS